MSILFRIQTYYPCKRMNLCQAPVKSCSITCLNNSCHLEAPELLETTFVFVDFPCIIGFEVLAWECFSQILISVLNFLVL